jgi:hypothetical protein
MFLLVVLGFLKIDKCILILAATRTQILGSRPSMSLFNMLLPISSDWKQASMSQFLLTVVLLSGLRNPGEESEH